MLLNKTNLELAQFASTDDWRGALTHLHITPEYTEATNGHALVRVQIPDVNPEEFPSIKGFSPNHKGEVCIPADAAKAIAKAIPRAKHLPILNHAAWDCGDTTDEVAPFAVTDLDNEQRFSPRPSEDKYPDTNAVWPKTEPGLTISFNGLLLAKVLRFMGGHANNLTHRVTFRFRPSWGKPGPTILELATTTEDDQKITAVVMPLVGDEEDA